MCIESEIRSRPLASDHIFTIQESATKYMARLCDMHRLEPYVKNPLIFAGCFGFHIVFLCNLLTLANIKCVASITALATGHKVCTLPAPFYPVIRISVFYEIIH